MSVILVDGFDVYNGTGVNTGLQAKWLAAGASSGSHSLVAGRFGGQAYRSTQGVASSGAWASRPIAANASIAVGFAFRAVDSFDGVFIFWGLASGTYQVGLLLDSTGKLSACRNTAVDTGTVLGTTAAAAIALNTWHYIECEITVSDTVGVFKVYVDGVQVLNLTGLDTRNGTPTTIDTIQVGHRKSPNGASSGVRYDFDDIYVVDAATKLGERRVETLYPSADTAQKDLTPNSGTANFSRVNEAQVDGDTSYVQGSTVGNTDRYDLGDLTGAPATIDAVQVSCFGEKTDATSRSIALQVKSGATTSDGSNFALAASYGKLERLLTTDPNGGGAWSAAAVNALQVGPKITV